MPTARNSFAACLTFCRSARNDQDFACRKSAASGMKESAGAFPTHLLPPGTYPWRDIGPDHAIYRTMFPLTALPQIPSIQFWRQTGGESSERGNDSAVPHLRGITDAAGRLMVLATHNTDISDAWEREGEDPEYFYTYSPNGYATAINIMLYAMSH